MTVLGLDIGGTSVKAAIFRGGRCVRTAQSEPYAKPSVEELREAIVSVVGSEKKVARVGICLPGIVDRSGKITHCVNIPALTGVRLQRLVHPAIAAARKPSVQFCSDAVATAYDIQRRRRLKGRLLVLSLGTGVGAAVLDGVVPLNVDEGSPGHFGQLDVTLPGRKVIGPDGGSGGLEGYIGAPALRKRHGKEPLEGGLADYIGNEPALLALVRALRITHAIYRPQHIVLCGGIGLALRHLLPTIRRQVAKDLTSLARPGWTLSCGDDLFHAARGAARMVLAHR